MIGDTTIEKVKTKAESQRKISTFKGNMKVIFDVINYVNSLDEFSTLIWPDHRLDEVPILNELSDFVLPASVRLDVDDLRTKQLLVRDKYPEPLLVSYFDYINALDEFRGNFKRDAKSDITNFAQLRKFSNLTDIMDKAQVGNKVRPNAKPFVPIPLDECVSELVVDDRYFIEKAESVLEDYIAEMKFI